MARIAAIDFGLKRIGIAVSDSQQKLAFPLTTVAGGKEAISNIIKALTPKIKEIERILVGLPLLLSGKSSEMTEMTKKFAEELQSAIAIPVELYDERLSSKMADRMLSEAAMNRKKRTQILDQASAALLLQSYLDKNNL